MDTRLLTVDQILAELGDQHLALERVRAELAEVNVRRDGLLNRLNELDDSVRALEGSLHHRLHDAAKAKIHAETRPITCAVCGRTPERHAPSNHDFETEEG